MSEQDEKQPDVLAVLAAMIEGDRVLGREASAITLAIPLRTFDKLASRPGFPKPAKLGKRLTWRKSELLRFWEAERDRQNAA